MPRPFAAATLLLLTAASPASPPAVASGFGMDRAVPLHLFDQAGYNPYTGPVLGPAGHLFGTLPNGGTAGCSAGLGCGAVYELIPGPRGKPAHYSTIYLFTGGADGGNPTSKPTVTRAGTLYGYSAGTSRGTVFELMPPAQPGQPWTFATIYTFAKGGGSLRDSGSPLLFHHTSLYGLAAVARGNALFRLSPPSQGGHDWTETTLYRFTPGETAFDLISDGALGFFAITSPAPDYEGGSVVQLNPPAHGDRKWTETTIATFHAHRTFDTPTSLIAAPNRDLYVIFGKGVYQLAPPQTGGTNPWSVSKIATQAAGGYGPTTIENGSQGSLITTVYGDQDSFGGVVFQLTPPGNGSSSWTTTTLTNFNTNNFPSSNPIDAIGAPGNVVYGAVNNTYDNGALFGLYPRN